MLSRSISVLKIYFSPRVLSMAVLGFPYGMMYFLAIPTLQFWMKQVGVSNVKIGFFAWACLPYMFKFLWAPLVGYLKIPFLGKHLGHRRSWLVMAHLFLMFFLFLLGQANPATHLLYTAFLSLCLAFFAGIQDIVVDAYRIEILDKDQSGPGVGMLISGYRLGAVTAQAGALYLADLYSWETAYNLMACLVVMGIIAALLNPEPVVPRRKSHFLFRDYVWPPLKDFFSRPGCWWIIAFIIVYRLGDAFINTMSGVFYLETGFTTPEIASVTKMFGMFPTLIGGLLGGALALRVTIYKSLLFCGVIHTLSHLMFVGQAIIGYSIDFLYGVIFLENITGGLTTAVFLLYLSRECNLRYTATQYAFFTSLWSTATFISGLSGWLLEACKNSWPLFFLFTFCISLPGLAIILRIKRFPLANEGAYKR